MKHYVKKKQSIGFNYIMNISDIVLKKKINFLIQKDGDNIAAHYTQIIKHKKPKTTKIIIQL